MVTNFSIKKNRYKFSFDQNIEAQRLLMLYRGSENGRWLDDIDWPRINFWWSSTLKFDVAQGARINMDDRNIYLAKADCDPFNPEQYPSLAKFYSLMPVYMCVDVMAHELRHIWQKKHYGPFLYYLCYWPEYIPGLYGKVWLEKDAFAVQDLARKFFDQIIDKARTDAFEADKKYRREHGLV